MAEETPKIWQPLHPAVRDKLDPQYVAWHDKYLQYIVPEELTPWNRNKKSAVPLPPGGTKPIPVGSIKEHDVGRFRLRVYTPTGQCQDDRGWPVLVWFHGGGWVNGNLNSGTDYCCLFCEGARCVVVSVDYGLAPENPFPIAVEDAIDSARWVFSAPAELGKIDGRRISIGGTSSGGTLAVVAAIAAANPEALFPSAKPSIPHPSSHPPTSLFLFTPVIDNTATANDVWKSSAETAPWLTAGRLTYYRNLYLSRPGDHEKWDASPNKAPESLLRNLPKTWLAVAEFDLLAPEALTFGEQLKGLGVDTEVVIVQGGTHSIMSLHGRIDKGLEMIQDGVKHLQGVFGT
ncbi:Alpha/Beta hydrolase protein [Thelonectria olida]|uniref:Alpha/Beta hydrolase protein n=1 Tax=Thelonectria olida TaxID=1576542 RepID=A0A9P9APF2_9HYPO|nr:Alpha/Beta hydrolase protein [Thelonectria olida]